jgi:hypothetical protein
MREDMAIWQPQINRFARFFRVASPLQRLLIQPISTLVNAWLSNAYFKRQFQRRKSVVRNQMATQTAA